MNLTKNQTLALTLLAHSPLRNKFYWTGGTLLAYHYLHHRHSEDLDFFTDTQFTYDEINPFVNELKEKAGFKTVEYQKVFDRYEFLFRNGESLRIEFVYYNGEKKRIEKKGELLGILIDSLADIAANKTMAYFDRNEPKDLFDLYFLLTKCDFTPQKLLDLAEKKFGVKMSESLLWSEAFKSLPLLTALTPLIEGSEAEQKKLLSQIENYFKENSREFLSKNLE